MLAAIDWTHVLIAVAAVVLREVMARYSPPATPANPTPVTPSVPAPLPALPGGLDLDRLLDLLRQLLHATPPNPPAPRS